LLVVKKFVCAADITLCVGAVPLHHYGVAMIKIIMSEY